MAEKFEYEGESIDTKQGLEILKWQLRRFFVSRSGKYYVKVNNLNPLQITCNLEPNLVLGFQELMYADGKNIMQVEFGSDINDFITIPLVQFSSVELISELKKHRPEGRDFDVMFSQIIKPKATNRF